MDPADIAIVERDFCDLLRRLSTAEIEYIQKQFQIGNITGDPESNIFATLAKHKGGTSSEAVRQRLGVLEESSIDQYTGHLQYGNTPNSSTVAKHFFMWCDTVLRERPVPA